LQQLFVVFCFQHQERKKRLRVKDWKGGKAVLDWALSEVEMTNQE
jgi:hypothetical protein